MEHVVFYPGADGTPAFARFADLAEAVAFVERLRNDDGVGEASLFALTPVPLVVRTYYRVEVPPVEPGADPVATVPAQPEPVDAVDAPAATGETDAAAPTSAEPEPPPAAEPVGVTPDIIAPAPSGRRSLGFFTH